MLRMFSAILALGLILVNKRLRANQLIGRVGAVD